MNEFSDVGMEVNSNNTLKMAKIESSHLEYQVSKPDLTGASELQLSEEAILKEKKKNVLRRTSTITYLFKKI